MKNIMCIICVMIMMLFTPFEACSVDKSDSAGGAPDATARQTPKASQEVLAYLNSASELATEYVELMNKLDKMMHYALEVDEYAQRCCHSEGYTQPKGTYINFTPSEHKLLISVASKFFMNKHKEPAEKIGDLFDSFRQLQPALAKFANEHR